MSKKCLFCGKPKIPSAKENPSAVARRKYCDAQCSGMAHRKSESFYQEQYERIRVDSKNIREHRYAMQVWLGRKLNSEECVHHINGNPLDNRIANLHLCSLSEHRKIHSPAVIKACPWCGDGFARIPSIAKKQIFCSRSCGAKSREANAS